MTQLLSGKKFLHIVRYGTAADQKFISGPLKDSYDVLALNANMVAHTPAAICRFVTEKLAGKDYFIDPQTHAFQHGLSFIQKKGDTEVKTSLKKLVDSYGEPFEKVLSGGASSVRPKDVTEHLSGFCERVVNFQLNHLDSFSSKEKESVDKYIKFLKKEGEELGTSGPLFVVSPYFYLTPTNYSNWASINIDCFVETKNQVKSKPVAIQIVISRDMLGSSFIADFIEKISTCKKKPDVILVWIDDFKEQEISRHEIENYIQLTNQLSKIAPVINLYGSFLSVVLGRNKIIKNLIGVGHGPEYGESRAVVPVGGGLPVSKYYFPPLRARLKFRDAVISIMAMGAWEKKDKFFSTICDCTQCKLVIDISPKDNFEAYGRSNTKVTKAGKTGPQTRSYPTSESKGICVKHYMLVKKDEYTSKDLIKLENVIDSLDRTKSKLASALDDGLANNCVEWKHVLKKYL